MKVSRVSPRTGQVNTLELDITEEDWKRYQQGGGLIQNVFPHLTSSEREFLMTGYTQADWDAIFPPEEQ